MKKPNLVRFVALLASAATLVFLAGCGGGADSSPPAESETPELGIAEQMEQREAAFAAEKEAAVKAEIAAEEERLANEAPSDVGKSDFKRGSKLQGGSRVSAALGGVLRATEDVKLKNIQHQLTIHGEGFGYPKSDAEFKKLIKEWGMQLPPLDGPYEYWYDAETHKIQKRPIASAEAAANE